MELSSRNLSTRSYLIDFVRGLALIIVIVDHFEFENNSRILSRWTPIALGFSDGAEIFVFISGYVCGLVYSRRLATHTFMQCQLRCIARTLQIYCVYVITAFVLYAINVASGSLRIPTRPWAVVPDDFRQILLMRYQQNGLAFLTFYSLVCLAIPALVVISLRARQLGWAVSVALYLMVQGAEQFGIAGFRHALGWHFNPLAWQMLFFIGLDMGVHRFAFRSSISKRTVLVVSIALLVFGAIYVKDRQLDNRAWPMQLDRAAEDAVSVDGKTNLHPLRILHFLALACVATLAAPFVALQRSYSISVLGMYTLPAFAIGLVGVSLTRAFGIQKEKWLLLLVECDLILFLIVGVRQLYTHQHDH